MRCAPISRLVIAGVSVIIEATCCVCLGWEPSIAPPCARASGSRFLNPAAPHTSQQASLPKPETIDSAGGTLRTPKHSRIVSRRTIQKYTFVDTPEGLRDQSPGLTLGVDVDILSELLPCAGSRLPLVRGFVAPPPTPSPLNPISQALNGGASLSKILRSVHALRSDILGPAVARLRWQDASPNDAQVVGLIGGRAAIPALRVQLRRAVRTGDCLMGAVCASQWLSLDPDADEPSRRLSEWLLDGDPGVATPAAIQGVNAWRTRYIHTDAMIRLRWAYGQLTQTAHDELFLSQAVEIFADIAPEKTAARLRALLNDRDARTRYSAARTLIEQVASAEALTAVIEWNRTEADPEVAVWSAFILLRSLIPKRRCHELGRAGLELGAPTHRVAGVGILQHAGTVSARRFARSALRSEPDSRIVEVIRCWLKGG